VTRMSSQHRSTIITGGGDGSRTTLFSTESGGRAGGVRISRLLKGSGDDKDNFRRFVGRWQSAQLSG
jgi:hypothetical protein